MKMHNVEVMSCSWFTFSHIALWHVRKPTLWIAFWVWLENQWITPCDVVRKLTLWMISCDVVVKRTLWLTPRVMVRSKGANIKAMVLGMYRIIAPCGVFGKPTLWLLLAIWLRNQNCD